jgi:thiamine transport system ATP-binding protein
VLLLDEPLTGLDRDLHDRLALELRHLLEGTTTVLVTHDPDEAAVVATRQVRMDDLAHSRR